MPVGLGILVLQYVADLICVVTGRTPPFGISDDRSTGMSPTSEGLDRPRRHLAGAASRRAGRLRLGAISVIFLMIFQGFDSMHVVAETFYSGLDEFTLVSIPMFIMMGAAVGSSPAGKDLYEALDRWLYRVPGGLVISNLGACAIFAALTGSSPATCAAIGKMGIPEMRERGYPDEVATGSICRRRHARHSHPALDHHDPLRHRHRDLDRPPVHRRRAARPHADRPVHGWTLFAIWRSGFRSLRRRFPLQPGRRSSQCVPKVLPFLSIIIGVIYVLYGGVATPSEAAGVGAALCLVLVVLIYRMWKPGDIWQILRDTIRESVMILMIIGASVLFGYMLTSLYVTQTLAAWIADARRQSLGADGR